MADTETPVTPDPTPTEVTPDPKEPAGSADTAGTSAAAPVTTAPAAPAPKKPAVDIDELMAAAEKAISDAAEQKRAYETREHSLKTKYGKYEELDEPLTKAETKEAKAQAIKPLVKQLLADGYDPSLLIEVFAEEVELPLEQIDPADLPKKIPEMISKEVSRLEKDRQAREAALAKEIADKKTAEEKAAAELKAKEDAETREEYLAEITGDLTGKDAAKFPLCNAWIHRITPEKVLAVAAGFAKVNHKAPTAEELFPAIEAEFRAEYDKAMSIGRPAPQAGQAAPAALDDIEAELEEMDRKRATLQKKDPTIPTGAPVPHGESGGNVMDDILRQLEREDAARAGRLTY